MPQTALIIDPVAWIVEVGGERIELTYLEFRLLLFLAEHPYEAFRREELLHAVWGPDNAVQIHLVDLSIHRLRRKLGEYGNSIRTVYRLGYSFELRGSIRAATATFSDPMIQ